MADVAYENPPDTDDEAVATAQVAQHLGRKPQSLSPPARDALMKKGLIYSGERGSDRVHRAALRTVLARPGMMMSAK